MWPFNEKAASKPESYHQVKADNQVVKTFLSSEPEPMKAAHKFIDENRTTYYDGMVLQIVEVHINQPNPQNQDPSLPYTWEKVVHEEHPTVIEDEWWDKREKGEEL